MKEYDWSKVEESGGYTPIPAGEYIMRVTDVKQQKKDGTAYATRDGSPMWRMELTVIEGDCEGRKVFDNLIFSKEALGRVKLVCSRLGIDMERKFALTPQDIVGRAAKVTVIVKERKNQNGEMISDNEVTFAGYEKLEGADYGMQSLGGNEGGGSPDDDLPF